MPSKKTEFATSFRAGIPGGVLRFAIFIPMGVYVNLAQHHWNVIKDHPELYDGIYSRAIPVGEKLAAKWGFFGFCWSFAAWIPAIILPAPINIVFGLVDGAIAGCIAHATRLLAGYSPKLTELCWPASAHAFQLPPGANESFFEAAARLNGTATDATTMCETFALEWQYGVTISIVYGAIAVLNIVFCVWVLVRTYWEAQREKRSFWKAILHSALAATRAIGVFIFAFIYYIPLILFRFLPISIKSRIRFARRWGVKAGQRLEEKSETQLKSFSKKLARNGEEKGGYQGKANGEPTNLAGFLSVYDMLISVVENLHYTDFANLSLVSRSVREAILPSEAYTQRMIHFKIYSCSREGKRECWSCLMQICSECHFPRSLRQTTPYFHLDTCRPYCTPCYYTTVQKPTSTSLRHRPMDPRICACAPPTPTPNFLQRWVRGQEYHASRQRTLLHVTRYVCRECNFLDDEALAEKRLGRTKWELKGGERQDDATGEMDRCWNCKGELGRGPRWWTCKLCWKECRSGLHGAWSRVERGYMYDVQVGDVAV